MSANHTAHFITHTAQQTGLSGDTKAHAHTHTHSSALSLLKHAQTLTRLQPHPSKDFTAHQRLLDEEEDGF